MNKYLVYLFIITNFIFCSNINAQENIMILKLKDGDVKIQLFSVEKTVLH